MTTHPRHVQRPDREAGSISVFVAVASLGLLVLIGLVVDGGVKLRAAQRADTVAAEAARAAGQQVALPAVVGTQTVRVDRQTAVNAANAYLAAAGEPGTVQISPDGTTVEVAVTTTAPTVFVSLIGIPSVTATGYSEARLIHRISAEQP